MDHKVTGRTKEEQEFRDRVVDSLTPAMFFGDMKERFGTRRMVELVGYAVLFGVIGVDDPAGMKKRYEEAGFTQRGTYRALADFRRLGDYLVEKHGPGVTCLRETKELMRMMRGNLTYTASV